MIPASHPHLRILLLCLLLVALVVFLHQPPFALFQRLELLTLDARFIQRGPRDPGREVVLVTIDEKSLTELGRWPWPRSYHAELVDVLRQQGAAVIAFAQPFSERSADPREDAALAAAIRRAGNVLLAADLPERGSMGSGHSAAQQAVEVLSEDRILSSDAMIRKSAPAPESPPSWLGEPTQEFFWTLPLPELMEAARGAGYLDLRADPDAIYRRAAAVRLVDAGRLYAHLALLAAAQKLGVSPREIRVSRIPEVKLGSRRRIPLSDDGTLLIDYAGPPASRENAPLFPRYSYSSVLALSPRLRARGVETEVGGIPAGAFRGKIVFVGATARSLSDQRANPYSRVAVSVEAAAHLTSAILQNRFFHQPGPWLTVALLAGIGLLFGRLLAILPMLRGTLVTLATAGAYWMVALWLFSGPRVIVPVAGPLITLGLCYSAVMAYRFQAESRERLRYQASLEEMERDRMRSELEIGRTIQTSLLPPTPVTAGDVQIVARYEPATEVGGDFYNLFPLSPPSAGSGFQVAGSTSADPSTCNLKPSYLELAEVSGAPAVGIVLGDVAGKGVRAAMFMTVATTLIEELARSGLSPAETLRQANERLLPKLRPHRMFVTLLYGVLEPESGRFTFASAGQTGPVLWARGAPPRFLRQSSLPLAAMETAEYDEQSCVLAPGDALVLFSDGLIEVGSADGHPLGYGGLLRILEQARHPCPRQWLDQIWSAISALAGPDRDDSTIIVVQRREA